MNIEHRLEQFYKTHKKVLNPPISDNEKAYLLKYIPNLPELLLNILSVFNGEIQKAEPANGQAFFMSATDIIEHYQMFSDELDSFSEVHYLEDHPIEIQQTVMDKRWFPLMSYDGDVYFMDMNPTQHGKPEQVFLINVSQGCDLFELVAKNRDEFLQRYLII